MWTLNWSICTLWLENFWVNLKNIQRPPRWRLGWCISSWHTHTHAHTHTHLMPSNRESAAPLDIGSRSNYEVAIHTHKVACGKAKESISLFILSTVPLLLGCTHAVVMWCSMRSFFFPLSWSTQMAGSHFTAAEQFFVTVYSEGKAAHGAPHYYSMGTTEKHWNLGEDEQRYCIDRFFCFSAR